MIALTSAFGILLATCLQPAPAQAAPRTFVASYGSGTICNFLQPCATFQDAQNATDPAGEINCLDAGDFTSGSQFTIVKSLTIDCAGLIAGLTGNLGGINIDGGLIVVKLRNLTINGTVGGSIGIQFLNGHSLYVENCKISGFHGSGSGGGVGIRFLPQSGTTGRLFVKDSVITDNGQAASGGGIVVQPHDNGSSARVVIDHTRVEGNTYGIFGNGTNTTGTISMTVTDSVVANNAVDGITSYTPAHFNGGGNTFTIVQRSSSVQNGNTGIVAIGPGAYVLLTDTLVASNVWGLGTDQGGHILSYQDNEVIGNVSDLAPTGTVTPK
jgi:hypothetical protein